jgi:hypothetical protein
MRDHRRYGFSLRCRPIFPLFSWSRLVLVINFWCTCNKYNTVWKKQRLPPKKDAERSSDPEVWLRWFNALSSREEGPVDEDDDEAEDDVSVDVSVAEKSDYETESELEVSEEE